MIVDNNNTPSFHYYLLAFLSVLALLGPAPGADAETGDVSFNIESQPLNKALIQFSRLTGIQFFYTEESITKTETQGLSGQNTVLNGLDALLMETGYDYKFSNPNTVRIFRSAVITNAMAGSEPDETRLLNENPETTGRNGTARQNHIFEIFTTVHRQGFKQDLQKTPISITAFTLDDIEKRSIENVEDLNILLPNVIIRGDGISAGTTGLFVVRGIPGVARYVDGVPQLTNTGSLFNILELERIEVLRGPQGTLYGKNAMNGVILYTTKNPRDVFGVRVKATTGSYNRRDIVVNTDIPLTDKLFSKFSIARFNRDGYVETSMPGFRHGNLKNDVFRAQLSWRPSDTFETLFTFDFNKIDQHQQANVLYDIIETQETVVSYNEQGSSFLDATHAFGQRKEYRTSSSYTGPGVLHDARSLAMNIQWDISDSLNFSSTSGVRSFNHGNYSDLDGSEYAYFEYWFYQKYREASQEFKFTGHTGPLNWTAGLYSASFERNLRNIRWQYEELPENRPQNSVFFNKRSDIAVFGEASYHLNSRLTLTGGLRFSREYIDMAFYEAAEERPPRGQITRNVQQGTQRLSRDAVVEAVIPHAVLQYQWTNDVMTYLSYSEGFNEGGVNWVPVNGELRPFDPEIFAQTELGLRSDLFNKRLRFNAAYFRGTWKDLQVKEVPIPSLFFFSNAGEARIEGLEIDTSWIPSDNLLLRLSMGWLDSRYTDVGKATDITIDSAFALAPEYSFSVGGEYNWVLPNNGRLNLNADFGWLDEHMTIENIKLQSLQEAYGLLNARLTYTSPDQSWNISLFGTNLTDEWYQLGGFSASLAGINQGVVARPREVGLTLSKSF